MRIIAALILFPLLSFGQVITSGSISSAAMGRLGVDVQISTDEAQPIEGIFELTVVFSQSVTGFATSDITIANGSAANLYTEDNITYTCNIIPNGSGDVIMVIPAGVVTSSNIVSNTLTVYVEKNWAFLTHTATSDIYYDFREAVQESGSVMGSLDPALNDLSGNGRNASLGSNVPSVSNGLNLTDINTDSRYLFNGSNKYVTIGSTGSAFLNRDFVCRFAFRTDDGQPTTGPFLFGNFDGTNHGLTFQIRGSGGSFKAKVNYQGAEWQSTSAPFVNNATGLVYCYIKMDFTNDIFEFNVNGANIPGTFVTSSMAALNPASYSCSTNLYIGTYNNNGTPNSNSPRIDFAYWNVTPLQALPSETDIRTYLTNRKATFELMSTVTDATYLLFPHDVQVNGTKAYVSGKGDDTSNAIDGSFAVIDISNPASISVLGGYNGTNDQIDGETVLVLSSTRVVHFVAGNALLFDVSTPSSPSLIRTVSYGHTGSINGAVYKNGYVFGGNKNGYIDVFDFSTIDSFTLVGSYDTTTDLGGDGAHDIDFADDNEHVALVARPASGLTYHFAIYKVFNAGSLISIGSWAYKSRLSTASLTDANRVRVVKNQNIAIVSGANNFATIDISNLSSPSVSGTFDMTTFASGLTQYRHRFAIPTWQVGLRLINITSPSSLTQQAGYYNSVTFATGNASFHDLEIFRVSGKTYVIVSCQSDSKVAVFRINRF